MQGQTDARDEERRRGQQVGRDAPRPKGRIPPLTEVDQQQVERILVLVGQFFSRLWGRR